MGNRVGVCFIRVFTRKGYGSTRREQKGKREGREYDIGAMGAGPGVGGKGVRK